MGGKGGGNSDAGEIAERLAQQYYDQTQPLRNQMIGNFETFMGGNYDVTRNPSFAPGRQQIEDQYQNARLGTISGMPRGGQMFDQLTNIEQARANSIADLATTIAQDEYNKLYGMAAGVPQQSMSTMSGLAGQQALAAAQQQAGKYGALGDIGMGAGLLWGDR